MMPQQGQWMNPMAGGQQYPPSFSPQSWAPIGPSAPGMGPPLYAQSYDFNPRPMGQMGPPMGAPGNFGYGGGGYFQQPQAPANLEPIFLPKFDVPPGGVPAMMGQPVMQGQGYGMPYQPNPGMQMGGGPMGNMPFIQDQGMGQYGNFAPGPPPMMPGYPMAGPGNFNAGFNPQQMGYPFM